MIEVNGVLALVIAAIGWSTGGLFMKCIDASSLTIAGLRSIVAFIGLLVLTRKLPVFVVRQENQNEEKFAVDKRATFNLWASAISYSATMIMFCFANKMTYAANAILLQYTAPIYVVILSPLLLGEKNSKLDYFSVIGVIAGMILFFADNLFGKKDNVPPQVFWGNIIAILSGVTFALSTVFLRRCRGNTSKSSFVLAQLITFIICIPFVVKEGILDVRSIIFVILLGVVQMTLPNYFYAIGINKVRALSAILISMLEPLMNPVWVAIFAHELPTANCVIGGIIILLFVVGNDVLRVVKARR